MRLHWEWRAWTDGLLRVAGVDEAGRGPLAGPVVAAAVVFPPGRTVRGVDDSKVLSSRAREELAAQIRKLALACAVGTASVSAIDRLNILCATELAMQRALRRLGVRPDVVLVDGRPIRGLALPQQAIIGGDALSDTIAAASILAKVWRDRLMDRLHRRFPGYGFDRNRGYPTPSHLQALRQLGPCPVHRQTFRPIADLLVQEVLLPQEEE